MEIGKERKNELFTDTRMEYCQVSLVTRSLSTQQTLHVTVTQFPTSTGQIAYGVTTNTSSCYRFIGLVLAVFISIHYYYIIILFDEKSA
jgi:hypothetical protein